MKSLVAVDILDASVHAVLSEAARFARQFNTTLDVLFVDGLPYVEALIHDPQIRGVFEAEAEKLRRAREVRLTELVDTLPADVRGRPSYHFGSRPAEKIAEVAASYDLLMVATHGRTGLGHLFMGSIAERVIRLAPVPTLVLRTGR